MWIVALLIHGCAIPLWANPAGEQVISGGVTFERGLDGSLTISQGSDKAIIHWQDFSIGAGELTKFVQPSSTSAVLNRVIGGLPSSIHGTLQANGRVLLINPNGILVGPTGRIDVGGFLASTLDVSDGEFLGGGDMIFRGTSTASVVNQGTINAIGGDIFLFAQTVENSGTLNAPQGTVGMAAGTEILLAQAGDERVFVRAGGNGSVTNGGTITAATAELKAHGNLYALAVNNTGVIRATSAAKKGGRVFLTATGGGTVRNSGTVSARGSGGAGGEIRMDAGPTGKVENSGTLDADAVVTPEVPATVDGSTPEGTATGDAGADPQAQANAAAGGQIVIMADQIDLLEGSMLRANGRFQGGTILVGGGFQGRDPKVINATRVNVSSGVTMQADGGTGGGRVIVWSDGDTAFAGSISARATGAEGQGGFAEVSGKQTLDYNGIADLRGAGAGATGTLLLDPTDFTVGSSEAVAIASNLASSNVVVSTSGSGFQAGNLTVSSPINYTSANSLTFLAHGSISFLSSVQNGGTGAVQAVAGWDGTTGFSGESGIVNGTAVFNTIVNAGGYGMNGGSIQVGATNSTTNVSFGSRFGATNVAAQNLSLFGSNTTGNSMAEVGYMPNFNVANFNVAGDISVRLKGDLVAIGGSTGGSHAFIGHGGRDTVAGTEPDGDLSGAISVIAGGNITLTGGIVSAGRIGHGGEQIAGALSGTITVMAGGNITGQGGTTGGTGWVQIGHGANALVGSGQTGNATGDISVTAAGDINFFGGSVVNSWAQIGHGNRLGNGNHSGNITVSAANITLQGGTGNGPTQAQIGHGGYNVFGDFSGDITINTGNLTLQGGSIAISFAQVGHGGNASSGNFSGAIAVNLTGNLSLIGGATVANAYAMIGHGEASTFGNGNRQGNIDVRVAGESSLVNGAVSTSAWLIGHKTIPSHVISDAQVSFMTGTLDYVSGSGATLTTLNADFATKFIANLAGGAVSVASTGTGGLTVANAWSYNSVNALSLLSTRNLTFAAKLQNDGTGAVQAVAGWDGSTGASGAVNGTALFDMIVAANAYGTSNGSIQIGSTASTASVSVYSRFGATNMAGYSMTLQGSDSTVNASAQLGYEKPDFSINSASGPITVQLKSTLNATGGGASGAYTQIGHGGADSTVGQAVNTFGGDITVVAPVAVNLTAGTGSLTYSQIGNGGHGQHSSNSGNLTVTTGDLTLQGGSGALVWTQIGNGGYGSDGNHTGNITITAQNVFLLGGSGTGNDGSAQIGHGGAVADGNFSGTIVMSVAGNLSMIGGSSSVSTVHIGHGTASSYTATGTRQGVIDVRVAGETSLVNGTGFSSIWTIGHRTSTSGGISNAEVLFSTGMLDYTSGNGATLTTLNLDFASKMGANVPGGAVTVASTGVGGLAVANTWTINTGNALTFLSTRDVSFAGGVQNSGAGAVNVAAGWNGSTGLTATPGTGTLMNFAAIQALSSSYGNSNGSVIIGSGTQSASVAVGSASGSTNVAAYGLTMQASTTNAAGIAQLGYRNAAGGTGAFNFALTSYFHALNRGTLATTQVGHGSATLAGGVVISSDLVFAQPFAFGALAVKDVKVLNGGVQNIAAGTSGAVTLVGGWNGSAGVSANQAVNFATIAATSANYGNGQGSVYIGDGSQTSAVVFGSANGSTNVAGYGLTVQASTLDVMGTAQLGYHNAAGGTGAFDFALTSYFQALNRSTLTTTQIGHGAEYFAGGTVITSSFAFTQPISFAALAAGDVLFFKDVQDGSGTGAGTGGSVTAVAGWDGVTGMNGNSAIANGNTLFATIVNAGAYGLNAGNIQIGAANSTTAVNVGSRFGSTNIAGNNLSLLGSNINSSASARLGYMTSSSLSNATINGAINARLSGILNLTAGATTAAYAQVGHGGAGSGGNYSGNITVTAQSVRLNGAMGGVDTTYTQIGHGAWKVSGDQSLSGAIALNVAGDLSLTGGSAFGAYARIGHGAASGTRQGNIDIRVGGETSLVNGAGGSAIWGIGHQTSSVSGTPVSNARVHFSTGNLDYSNSSAATLTTLNADLATKFIANLAGGDVSIASTGAGGLLVANAFTYSSNNALTFLSTRDVQFSAGVQSTSGSGTLNVGAGWDGATGLSVTPGSGPLLNFAAIQNSPSSYGNSNGMVFIGTGAQTSVIAVGTNAGSTNIVGYGLVVQASTTNSSGHAQLGINGVGGGGFDLRLKSFFHVLNRGTVAGAEFGNGGSFAAGWVVVNGSHEITLPYAFGALSAGSVNFYEGYLGYNGGLQNSATTPGGNITVVAGWDGTTGVSGLLPVDYEAIRLNPASYGNNLGSVGIGDGMQSAAVSVGSRFGTTNVAGYSLNVKGSVQNLWFLNPPIDTSAQLGFRPPTNASSYSISGPINVLLKSSLSVTGGNAYGSWAQVGNGGPTSAAAQFSNNFGGDISIIAPGGVFVQAGTGISFDQPAYFAHAQIGNGGMGNASSSGNLSITTGVLDIWAGGSVQTWAALGNGGYGSDGNHSGNIKVSAVTVDLRGGMTGTDNYAQVGHGGALADGNHSGSILISGSELRLLGGPAAGAWVMIGHGSASTTATTGTRQGLIDVRVTTATLSNGLSPSSLWVIGNRSSTPSGISNSEIYFSTGGISFPGPLGGLAGSVLTQLGLNTVNSNSPVTIAISGNAPMVVTGAMTYNGASDLTLLSRQSITFNASLQNSGSGAINIAAGWDGATGQSAFATRGTLPSMNFAAIQALPSSYGNYQGTVNIGSGSQTTTIAVGSANGRISIAAYALSMDASTTTAAGIAQLGYRGLGGSTSAFDINLKSYFQALNRGTVSTTQIGNGASVSAGGVVITSAFNFTQPFSFSALARRDVSFLGGQIQNSAGSGAGTGGSVAAIGGWDGVSGFTFGSATNVNAILDSGNYGLSGGSVVVGSLTGVTAGSSIGSRYAATTVAGSDVRLYGNGTADATQRYAQIGFRVAGSTTNVNVAGSITVQAKGTLLMTGLAFANSDMQIGHGGRGFVAGAGPSGNWSGDIAVGAGVMIIAANGTSAGYAQVGHGGVGTSGTRAGDIVLNATHTFVQNISLGSATHIGHGGQDQMGDASGDIRVIANYGIALGGGGLVGTQIGHGGNRAQGVFSGDIDVVSEKGVVLNPLGGVGGGFAQIGHGGDHAGGVFSGDIHVKAHFIELRPINSMDPAQIGHGGNASIANQSGDITVEADDLMLKGSDTGLGHAQIGHGDGLGLSGGTRQGAITVTVGLETNLIGGTGSAPLWQIGHRTSVSGGVSNAPVSLTTGTLDEVEEDLALNVVLDESFATVFTRNLVGGDVFVNATDPLDGLINMANWAYDSPHHLTFNSARGMSLGGFIVNTGVGSLTFITDNANPYPLLDTDVRFINHALVIGAGGGVTVYAPSVRTSVLGSLAQLPRRYGVWYGDPAAIIGGLNFKDGPPPLVPTNDTPPFGGPPNPPPVEPGKIFLFDSVPGSLPADLHALGALIGVPPEASLHFDFSRGVLFLDMTNSNSGGAEYEGGNPPGDGDGSLLHQNSSGVTGEEEKNEHDKKKQGNGEQPGT